MGYCNHCGTALPPESLFCPECGMKVDHAGDEMGAAAVPVAVPQIPVKTSRKPLGKAAIWWIAGIAAAVIIVVGLYGVGASLTDKDRVLHQFEAAVKSGDSGKLEKLLIAEDKGISRGKMAESLIGASKEYPSFLSDAMTDLKKQAKTLDKNKKSKKDDVDLESIFGEDSIFSAEDGQSKLLTLKKQGKSLLVFDRYVLQLQPYRLSVMTNLENTAVYVDDVQVGTIKDGYSTQVVENLLPGLHKVKTVFEGDFAHLEKEEAVDLFSLEDRESQITLNLPDDFVYLRPNYGEAAVYLDGKSVTAKVKDGDAIGPIAFDGTHKAVAEMLFPWGKFKSEEATIGQMYQDLTIEPLTDEVKEQIMTAAASFYKSWTLAYTSFDASRMKNVDAQWAKSLTEAINESKEAGERVIITSKSVTFDLDSFELTHDSNGYLVSVDARNLDSGASYNNTYSEAPSSSDFENDRTFELAFSNGEWKVLGATSTYFFNDAHTKVIRNS